MKIIIAGAGDAGTYLAKMLYNAQKDIIVIDQDEERLAYLDSHFDFLTIRGSATSISTLMRADIQKADLFISITKTEELNITSALLAKKLGAKKVIARIDNKEYLEEENYKYFKELGINSLIYPEILASEEIVQLLNQTGAIKTYEFAEGKLSLFAIKLDTDAPIIGKFLMELSMDEETFEYRAVAIIRNGKTIIPKGYDRFEKDDLVYVISNDKSIDKIMEYSGKQKFDVKNIIIMGGSRIGLKTAQKCEARSYVKIIEQNKLKCNKLVEKLSDALVIHGDGRDTDLLIEEGLENTDAFVAVTGNSETNILACLQAQKMGVRKVIAEIENIDYLPLASKMGIETVINKKVIAASHIYAYVMTAQISSVQCLISTDAEILEYTVPENAKITKTQLKNMKFPKNAIIGGVVRNKNIFIAKGDTQIQARDKVIIFAMPDAFKKIGKLFLK